MNIKVKRAIIATILAALVIIGAYFIPGVKESKLGDFLKGGSVGAASVALLVIVIAVVQRPNTSQS